MTSTSSKKNQSTNNKSQSSWFSSLVYSLIGLGLAGAITGILVVGLLYPQLPDLSTLTDYRPKVPLRVTTADGVLIGEFGEEKRQPVLISETPLVMQKAILAAEDDGFYSHFGIDPKGIARALLSNISAGGKSQGASTITMQVARNFFLKREKTWTRKAYEVLLALKIEANLSKDEILALYMNQIYLGQRAYGFASAADIYFGKRLQQITTAEAAMLAGLPKAPSAYNPIVNPGRARIRQEYVLRRMRQLNYISEETYQNALAEKLVYRTKKQANSYEVEAEFAAEMARQAAVELYGEEAYTAGITVTTTLISDEQNAAYRAVRKGVMDYELRQYYRGPEGFVELPASDDEVNEIIADKISEYPDHGELVSAVVLSASAREVVVSRGNTQKIVLKGEAIEPARSWLNPRAPSNKRLKRGAVVRILVQEGRPTTLTQMPEVEAAHVAINTADGAIRSLVGGFEFAKNKFNHVTQSIRQPGSSFKPFIYSAALEKGITPTTMIADEPIFIPAAPGGEDWSPKNYDGKYDGPMLLKTGLARSKNMISIRVLQEITPEFAQSWATQFGFSKADIPPYLTIALGAVTTNPLQLASAYSVFANKGFRVKPFLIQKITDLDNRVIAQAKPLESGNEINRVIDERNAFMISQLLQEVIMNGTGAKAKSLGRTDIFGKTGTTNDSHDAWFAGYNPDIAAVTWVGYDQPRNLGARETGGGLALPIWIDAMRVALENFPERPRLVPPGVDFIDGDYYYSEFTPDTGIAAIGVDLEQQNDSAPGILDFFRGLGETFSNQNSRTDNPGPRDNKPTPAQRRPSPERDEIEQLFGN